MIIYYDILTLIPLYCAIEHEAILCILDINIIPKRKSKYLSLLNQETSNIVY